MQPIKEVVVPIDGSDNSMRAVRFGVHLAKGLSAKVRLFYVFPLSSVEVIGMAGMSRDDIDQSAQQVAQRVFDKVHAELGETDVEVSDDMSIGDPAEEIIRCTEDDEGVHVVLGRRGLSRMQSLLLGSVSEKVVRHAHSPVTVVV